MAIRKVTRGGRTVLVIDIQYKLPDGTRKRYRRDAQVQTMIAAREEERRLLTQLGQSGNIPTSPPPPPSVPLVPEKATVVTFKAASETFMATQAAARLKPSTRRGYQEVLDTEVLPRMGELLVTDVCSTTFDKMGAAMAEAGASPSRLRNAHVVVRSVLKAAVESKLLSELPRLPKLPKVGGRELRFLTATDVQLILEKAPKSGRLVLALAAFAGLRAGEVRGLRWTDVDEKAGEIIVRRAICRGVVSTPKSGHQRKVPIAQPLAELLKSAPKRGPWSPVAPTEKGEVWGEWGLLQVFRKACKKASIKGFRFHDLRHYFVSELFRRGIPAPVVQALAGHADLATTQRYAHHAVDERRAAIAKLGEPLVSTPAETAVASEKTA